MVVNTYVTTSLIADIARSFGVKAVDDLLVGFKFIGELIEKLEDNKSLEKDALLFTPSATFTRDRKKIIKTRQNHG